MEFNNNYHMLIGGELVAAEARLDVVDRKSVV